MPTTTERGYGKPHQRLRAYLLPRAYGTPCWRCGETMRPGQALHLGHDDRDRRIYRGMEHATCNLRAGALEKQRRAKVRGSWRVAPRVARVSAPLSVPIDDL